MPDTAIEVANGQCINGENKKNDKNGGEKEFSLFCDERGYLSLVGFILQNGVRKGDRTGTGVISVFGTQARYSLRGQSHLLNTLSLPLISPVSFINQINARLLGNQGCC